MLDLPIDNDRAENAIRPFVVGRKAWLFSDTVAGANANASSVIYSMLETAKANGWNLTHGCGACCVTCLESVDQIKVPLPWNVKDLHTADLTRDMPG